MNKHGNSLKKWLISILTAMIFMVPASVTVAAEQSDPYVMINEVAMLTFDRIKREKSQIKSNPELLRTVMEEELLPYIDYRFSAFKVLGKYANKVPREKLLEFVSVFREYLITSYAVALGYYDDQQVEFAPAMEFDGRSDVTVRAVIKDGDRPDIKVAFKVRKDRQSDQWQVYDMVAEGISLLSSKRTEFESILRQDGIDKVIELMRKSIAEPIKLNEKLDK
ncbi:toluene tolerance family protein [Glaciecola nitratireducens FR1064]|uniref:Toluene tolerance family protein n=1 Tax=Glaciecola nitratireducens (strain JCM 12485 / KCTC 12276 / FR1064) TaxID=1085623 RepID=G4QFU3_GLANF|nr:toluene tolerance family protein [Glaciecola nitratireducens FR1064]